MDDSANPVSMGLVYAASQTGVSLPASSASSPATGNNSSQVTADASKTSAGSASGMSKTGAQSGTATAKSGASRVQGGGVLGMVMMVFVTWVV
jgi:hypothetical protein